MSVSRTCHIILNWMLRATLCIIPILQLRKLKKVRGLSPRYMASKWPRCDLHLGLVGCHVVATLTWKWKAAAGNMAGFFFGNMDLGGELESFCKWVIGCGCPYLLLKQKPLLPSKVQCRSESGLNFSGTRGRGFTCGPMGTLRVCVRLTLVMTSTLRCGPPVKPLFPVSASGVNH